LFRGASSQRFCLSLVVSAGCVVIFCIVRWNGLPIDGLVVRTVGTTFPPPPAVVVTAVPTHRLHRGTIRAALLKMLRDWVVGLHRMLVAKIGGAAAFWMLANVAVALLLFCFWLLPKNVSLGPP
jgi:hypothetical protein